MLQFTTAGTFAPLPGGVFVDPQGEHWPPAVLKKLPLCYQRVTPATPFWRVVCPTGVIMMVRSSTLQPHHDALLVGVHHDVSQAKAAATPWCP